MGAATGDYDNDGYLDLFVGAYADFTLATNRDCFLESGVRDYRNPRAYPPLPPHLYDNLRDGRFAERTAGSTSTWPTTGTRTSSG